MSPRPKEYHIVIFMHVSLFNIDIIKMRKLFENLHQIHLVNIELGKHEKSDF